MGANGMTHIRLAAASEDALTGALRTAWNLWLQRTQNRRKAESQIGRVTIESLANASVHVCSSRVQSFGTREISERDCIEYTENLKAANQ